mmetsp:Transcript_54448/g.151039  ORF Transcript_54448/g.151039 Transcript_54448/m.151039 type:complete len:222 (+) Transcript_54448:1071-1736(+)
MSRRKSRTSLPGNSTNIRRRRMRSRSRCRPRCRNSERPTRCRPERCRRPMRCRAQRCSGRRRLPRPPSGPRPGQRAARRSWAALPSRRVCQRAPSAAVPWAATCHRPRWTRTRRATHQCPSPMATAAARRTNPRWPRRRRPATCRRRLACIRAAQGCRPVRVPRMLLRPQHTQCQPHPTGSCPQPAGARTLGPHHRCTRRRPRRRALMARRPRPTGCQRPR